MPSKKEIPVTRVMHNPAHPGVILKETVIKPLKLTVSNAAEKFDIDRTTLSRLINGHISISVDMALRLSKALGSTPQFWLNLQQSYDLWKARQRCVDLSRVQRFESGNHYAPI